MRMDFADKVVVVTGAGRGLGRAHAIEFAKRGAKVVVNDPGGAVDGTGSGNTAQSVVNEIVNMGGEAIADTASVAEVKAAKSIIDNAVRNFGTVDILVNNAGILRDKTFANMTMHNFQAVLDVHLMGSIYTTKAAWPIMSEKGWGRVVLTSDRSGIFGNFGQSNYATAKMGVIGLMNVLKLEGVRKGIKVNCLAPGATTRMTEKLSDPALASGEPSLVSPAVLLLCSESAPNGIILQAQRGQFRIAEVCVNDGIDLGSEVTYEDLLEHVDEILDGTSLHPAPPRVPQKPS